MKSLLIANRGEIACRIIRTAGAMGIRTVSVYSDADAKALHVRMADEAVHIGPSPARESYLVGDKIIAAAKAAKAQAIHPGYGFLSENADFAQAVIDAGLVWVGPKPDSIRAMGLKDAAKKLMAEAGVPVTPGYLGEDQSPKRLQKEADAIGYPVLIKAVAGGGGKGMRRVDKAKDFQDALDSCKREAASSFGDDRVLIEKYILSPAPHRGAGVRRQPRQRRPPVRARLLAPAAGHQKVIEEAPAPGHGRGDARAVCGAAVRAAKAVNYEGAGTIEFIADASKGLTRRSHLVHGNEHAAAGRASGDRGDHRAGPGRMAAPRRERREAAEDAGRAVDQRLGDRGAALCRGSGQGFLPSVGRLSISIWRGGPDRDRGRGRRFQSRPSTTR
jgi:3-methylcrotonyl-CoA carboxylase alpha subunit